MHNEQQIAGLKRQIAPFEKTDTRASLRQLANTLLPLLALWYAAYLSLSVSYWLTLPLVIVAAGLVVRTFIIFHDCTHYSFFKSRRANDFLGNILAVIVVIPFQQWKNEHAIHHATSSNLDKRGVGDIWIMTLEEYEAASAWKRFSYRIYRNPIVLFLIGPVVGFLFMYRFNRKEARRKERLNTYFTNVAIVVVYALIIWAVGWQAFLLVHGPIFWLSGIAGVWLFYVQHQFEDTYFEKEDEWSYVRAAVEGSSYYKLPKVLQWLTGNIGYHHIHHLSSKVPNYRLETAQASIPALQHATTITLGTSLKALRFRLWDEEGKAFLTFGEARRLQQERKAASQLAAYTAEQEAARLARATATMQSAAPAVQGVAAHSVAVQTAAAQTAAMQTAADEAPAKGRKLGELAPTAPVQTAKRAVG